MIHKARGGSPKRIEGKSLTARQEKTAYEKLWRKKKPEMLEGQTENQTGCVQKMRYEKYGDRFYNTVMGLDLILSEIRKY